MEEQMVIRNDGLGVSMTKARIQDVDVVWAEDVRQALKWDSVPHMIRGLKDGKEVIKVSISDLSTTLIGFLPNLAKTSEKGGRPMKYAYFLTRQGVARLIATRRPHDIKDDPALADWLDRLQDWIYGEVLPEALATGRYSGKPLLAGQHAIDGMPANIADALRMMADEYDAHDLSIKALKEAERTKAQISEKREATACQRNSVLQRKLNVAEVKADKYDLWNDHKKHPNGWNWQDWETRKSGTEYIIDEYGNPVE